MIIDYVVELLKDGKWHYARSIARKLNEPESRVWEILKFCVDFNFIALDKTGNKAKIDERFKRLLT